MYLRILAFLCILYSVTGSNITSCVEECVYADPHAVHSLEWTNTVNQLYLENVKRVVGHTMERHDLDNVTRTAFNESVVHLYYLLDETYTLLMNMVTIDVGLSEKRNTELIQVALDLESNLDR